MRWWYRLLDRHDDGTEHRFMQAESLGRHWCDGDYCHHYRVVCTVCGTRRIHGYSIPEVR